jgi:hypothetical protein
MSDITKKQTIAVWFSCGAASAVAAKLTLDKYKDTHNVLIINNPVNEEHEDNWRFLLDVQKWLNHEIIFATSSEAGTTSAVDVWEKRKYMAGNKGAPCTMLLKKGARKEFEIKNKIDWHVLGFTADEQSRHDRFTTFERENVIPILIEAGLSKIDCFQVLKDAGIKLPEIYLLGFPNANCIGCVKSASPAYWDLVRSVFPDIFKHRSEQSRRIGAKLVRLKGKRIFLDELPVELPPTIKKLRSTPECGIFCYNGKGKP